MIHFSLRCEPEGHDFDGWFRSGADFERQAAAGIVECPVCGTARVAKALMRPAIGRATDAAPPEAAETPPTAAAPKVPDAPAVHAAVPPEIAKALSELQKMTRRLRASAENVGQRFADEARRIHYGESEARQIYGEASRAEVESLAEEGIAAIPLPPLPEDHN